MDLDAEAILQRVEGDVELLGELVQLFLADCPQWLDTLHKSIEAGDGRQIKSAAHALKGAASNFQADEVVRLAAQMEELGKNGDLAGAREVYPKVAASLGRLQVALVHLVGNAGV
jgi:HPt (histidine-containing phosphotransfer) domain-containing protein